MFLNQIICFHAYLFTSFTCFHDNRQVRSMQLSNWWLPICLFYLSYIMNMLDIDSLVDSLVSLATWPHIWNYLDKRPAYSTLNYWSILLPCQLQVKLTGTPPRSRPSGPVVSFLSPKRKLGIYSVQPLPCVDHCVPGVKFLASTEITTLSKTIVHI